MTCEISRFDRDASMSKAVEGAYRAICAAITEGVYRPGAHINAHAFATRTGLSRTPIREAMRRLAAEGIIEIVPNRGAFVPRRTSDDTAQLLELRTLLESFISQLAARRATNEQITSLRDLAAHITIATEASDLDRALIADLNHSFHRQLLEACGDARLADFLRPFMDIRIEPDSAPARSPFELRNAAGRHVAIIDAIALREPALAGAAMSAHMRQTYSREQLPGWSRGQRPSRPGRSRSQLSDAHADGLTRT